MRVLAWAWLIIHDLRPTSSLVLCCLALVQVQKCWLPTGPGRGSVDGQTTQWPAQLRPCCSMLVPTHHCCSYQSELGFTHNQLYERAADLSCG